MVQLVLTEEQSRLARDARDQLTLVDPSGRVVGSLLPYAIPDDDPYFTREEIEEAHRRRLSDEPTHTTAEVLAYLESLESEKR